MQTQYWVIYDCGYAEAYNNIDDDVDASCGTFHLWYCVLELPANRAVRGSLGSAREMVHAVSNTVHTLSLYNTNPDGQYPGEGTATVRNFLTSTFRHLFTRHNSSYTIHDLLNDTIGNDISEIGLGSDRVWGEDAGSTGHDENEEDEEAVSG